MKRRMRAKVWWQRLDRDVEQHVKMCRSCLLVSQLTRPPPMKRLVFPGRQFVSAQFKDFCEASGITLIATPPYWPQSNGEVENMNRSLGKRLKIASLNKGNFKEELQKFILTYNTTPHGTAGSTPSELMFNRTIRDKLPDIRDIIEEVVDTSARDNDLINKQKGKLTGDKVRGAKESDIKVGDKVLLKNVIFLSKLTPNFETTEYKVVERNGNEVELFGNGRKVRRNVSHCKRIPSNERAA
ncbi:uncharacterized protein LOC124460840 [Drosophila willistoni]|uniref:uncharacterized protein LOC124460840 n=1 Tax=Drosophila willistoni TaxID=7260 RepID=UPI001F079DAC|nr:uncharacterized protein LOC124460840 [Drosophila willistoni]